MDSRPLGILIIEKDAMLRDVLSQLLEESYPVTRTASTRLALDLLSKDPLPRWVLICGQDLPELDAAGLVVSSMASGFEVAGVILLIPQGTNETSDPRFVTARQECLKKAIPFVIVNKPCSELEIIALLEGILPNTLSAQ